MKIEELDPTLMMYPSLNKIINLSTLHHKDLSKSFKRHRANLASTCLYHNILDSHFKESSMLQMVRGKPQYPKMFYLGNIEIEYLPDYGVWKVTITNGGKKRKNAKLSYKIKAVLYIRKLQGIYIIDKEFRLYILENVT